MLSSIQIIRYMRVMDAMMPPCEYIKKGKKKIRSLPHLSGTEDGTDVVVPI